MNVSLVNKLLLAAVFLMSHTALAQEVKLEVDLSSPPTEIISIAEEAEIMGEEQQDMGIEIAEYAAPQSGAIGLQSANELNVPDDLWYNVSEADALKLLDAISEQPKSKAVQTILYRVLTMETARGDFTEAMLMARVNTLLKLGQAELARQLLAAVPESLVSPDMAKQTFLLEMAKANSREKLCLQAQDQQSNAPDAFWQRFNVLCHASAGKNAKAQLGLSLLREQNNASEIFSNIVNSIGEKEVKLEFKESQREALIWSLFTKASLEVENLTLEQQALLALSGKPKEGMNVKAVSVPNDNSPDISLSLMRLKPSADNKEKRKALLAVALRRVWDKPISVEMEDALLSTNYRGELTELSTIWREATGVMLENNQRLAALLMMLRPVNQPLSHYTVGDIAFMSSELNALGLASDAVAIAEEALKGD